MALALQPSPQTLSPRPATNRPSLASTTGTNLDGTYKPDSSKHQTIPAAPSAAEPEDRRDAGIGQRTVPTAVRIAQVERLVVEEHVPFSRASRHKSQSWPPYPRESLVEGNVPYACPETAVGQTWVDCSFH